MGMSDVQPPAPAHRRVLLEGEGARQRRRGHPLLHGHGAALRSPWDIWAAGPRIPRPGQGECGTVVVAPRCPFCLLPLSAVLRCATTTAAPLILRNGTGPPQAPPVPTSPS